MTNSSSVSKPSVTRGLIRPLKAAEVPTPQAGDPTLSSDTVSEAATPPAAVAGGWTSAVTRCSPAGARSSLLPAAKPTARTAPGAPPVGAERQRGQGPHGEHAAAPAPPAPVLMNPEISAESPPGESRQ